MNVLVCGDSHSSIFQYCNSVQTTYNFIGPGCAGASARGVLNPSSISDSYNVFNERLKNSIQKSITNLFEFIKTEVLEKYGYQNPQVIVVGSILAAIGDDVDKRRLHSLRPNVKATQREVTCLILAYNCELKRLCLQAGYTYFDITHRTMGDNGTINPYYVRENKYDHHLEPDKIRDLYMDELTKALQH